MRRLSSDSRAYNCRAGQRKGRGVRNSRMEVMPGKLGSQLGSSSVARQQVSLVGNSIFM